MAKASIWLRQFRRDADFTAHKPMRVQGRDFQPGDPFDKTLVSTRRLRQLYEARKVVMAPASSSAPKPYVAPEPKAYETDHPVTPTTSPVTVGAHSAIGGHGPHIPDDWRSLPWQTRRSLASKISDDPIKNSDDADAAIELELERRQSEAE